MFALFVAIIEFCMKSKDPPSNRNSMDGMHSKTKLTIQAPREFDNGRAVSILYDQTNAICFYSVYNFSTIHRLAHPPTPRPCT